MPNTIKKQTRATKTKSTTQKPTSATRVNARKSVSKTARNAVSTSALKTVSKTAGKTAKPAAALKLQPKKQAKLIRDSFSIPENEFALLAETKKNCLKAGLEIKKSELIRIGIILVHQLTLARLKKAKKVLQPVKTGRPKKFK
jgi:hypothetical protein